MERKECLVTFGHQQIPRKRPSACGESCSLLRLLLFGGVAHGERGRVGVLQNDGDDAVEGAAERFPLSHIAMFY